MAWLWMNIPLAAACFAAWFGIPLWMVLRHPNWGPEHHDSPPRRRPAGPRPVLAGEYQKAELADVAASSVGSGRY